MLHRHGHDIIKPPRRDSNPQSPALEADALSIRPSGRLDFLEKEGRAEIKREKRDRSETREGQTRFTNKPFKTFTNHVHEHVPNKAVHEHPNTVQVSPSFF